jgi:hypothetical protein
MPRYRRQIAEGSVQHVISRFVNREFLFDLQGSRDDYLSRVPGALERTGWHALSFALMSSHVHWGLRAGPHPSSALVKPLHAGFARWLNRSHQRLGPVFADRHRSLTFEGETAALLLAYIHNNPVRAGLVTDPADSPWTSHRAYLGLTPAPPWLDVALGLHLCGYSATSSGRLAFHDMVRARASESRRADLSGEDLQARRRRERSLARTPVELATPTVTMLDENVCVHARTVAPDYCPPRPCWHGSTEDVIEAVALAAGVTVADLRGTSRVRVVAAARRLAMITWTESLGRPCGHMARALGIAASSGSELIVTACPDVRARAMQIAHALRRSD